MQVVEPGEIGDGAAATDHDKGVERALAVGSQGILDGGADGGRGIKPLEGRPEELELAQFRSLEPVGLPLEVPQTCRVLGADDGDTDEIERCWEPLVAVEEPCRNELLPDASHLGSEVTESERRVYVLDDEVEAVEHIEPDFGEAEDLDVGPEPFAGDLLELGGDGLCSASPDDSLDLGEDVPPFVPLGQGQIQVNVLAT